MVAGEGLDGMGWAQKEEDGSERRNRQTARQTDRGTPFLGGHTQTASKKIDLVEEESEVKSGERSVALNKCRTLSRLNDSVVAFLFLRFASCEEGS